MFASVSLGDANYVQALPGAEFSLLLLGAAIATIGFAALGIYAFRRRTAERILLWFGLFAAPYGVALVLKTSALHLTFHRPFWLFGGRLIELTIMIPALLLFEEFYGKGWRGSVRKLIWFYAAFATVAFAYMVIRDEPGFIPAPGTGMILFLPAVLLVGHLAGYRAPVLPDRKLLVAGLIMFFLAFSRDHLSNAERGVWRPGIEPYGFLVLIVCLGYAAVRRIAAGEKQFVLLNEEMRAATRIQSSILPRDTPSTECLQVAVRYSPMTAVAGDFYDFLTIDPGRFGVLVADVVGHGVPAAIVASMVKVALSTQAPSAAEPGQVMSGLNSILCRQAQGQYTTAVYLFLDTKRRMGRYSAAGHPPALLWRNATRTVEKLASEGLLLGVKPNEEYAQTEFTFEARDRLLLYTDGLLEAENSGGEAYGLERVMTSLEDDRRLGAEEFADRLLAEVMAWPERDGRESQEDDLTLIVIDFARVTD